MKTACKIYVMTPLVRTQAAKHVKHMDTNSLAILTNEMKAPNLFKALSKYGLRDENLFVKLVEHIRANGYTGSFYSKEITYYDEDGLVYWTMGAPVEETVIINRCRKEQTYEYRLANNDLPG